MLKKYRFLAPAILLVFSAIGQNRYSFTQSINTEVYHGNDTLSNAWAGGLNYPVFSNMDLNRDGNEDLLVYDRNGYRVLPYIATTINGVDMYRYDPQYAEAFPIPKTHGNFLFMRDYNCDGEKDIFYHDGVDLFVYENVSQGNELSFEPAPGGNPVYTDYINSGRTKLFMTEADMPDINDVTGDGNLDILVYGFNSTRVELHENMANCGLDFKQTRSCWGGFTETGFRRELNLNACSTSGKKETTASQNPEGVMHSGSALLSLDLNDNSLPDLLVSNVEFNNLTATYNGGTIDTAEITSQDTLFPAPHPVDLFVFPAPFYVDTDQDGVPDLVTSSYNNATSGSPDVSNNHKGIWRYKNSGSETSPNFQFVEENFLQKDMIDWGALTTPRLVDINGDSLTDIILAIGDRYIKPNQASSQLYYYKNTGTAAKPAFTLQDTNFADLPSYNLGTNLTPAFGDLDGDGDLDMILGTGNGWLHEFENTGSASNPQLSLKNTLIANTDVGAFASPYLFDMDDDGDLDLFVGNNSGRLYYLENAGSASAPDFQYRTDFFGAIDTDRNSKPALVKDSSGTTLFTGSHTNGVIQYDDIDTVANLPFSVNGQLGSNEQTSSNFEQTPFGISKRSGRNQFLIRSSEMIAAGLFSGFIDGMSFNVTDPGGNTISNGFTIKLKSTSKNSLTGFESFSGTPVWDTRSKRFNQGWNFINFTNPWHWDGQSNIVIEICFRGNFPDNDIKVAMSNTSFDSHALGDITGYNTFSANGCAMPFKESIQMRPDVTFYITPSATPLPDKQNPKLFPGFNAAPDFADLNNDGYLDAVVGNTSGGLSLYFGRQYEVGLPERKATNLEFDVFPNPAQTSFTLRQKLSKEDPIDQLQIMDYTGKIIQTHEVKAEEQRFNISQLPPGVYLIRATGNKTAGTKRLIIAR